MSLCPLRLATAVTTLLYTAMFDIWKKQKIADYSTLPVTKKVYEDIDNAARMKLRNEHLERQFKKIQNDSE